MHKHRHKSKGIMYHKKYKIYPVITHCNLIIDSEPKFVVFSLKTKCMSRLDFLYSCVNCYRFAIYWPVFCLFPLLCYMWSSNSCHTLWEAFTVTPFCIFSCKSFQHLHLLKETKYLPTIILWYSLILQVSVFSLICFV